MEVQKVICDEEQVVRQDMRARCMQCGTLDALMICGECEKYICAGCFGESPNSEGICPTCNRKADKVRADLITFVNPDDKKQYARLLSNLHLDECYIACPNDGTPLVNKEKGVEQCSECNREYLWDDIGSAPEMFVRSRRPLGDLNMINLAGTYRIKHEGQEARALGKIMQHYAMKCSVDGTPMVRVKRPGQMEEPLQCPTCGQELSEHKAVESFEEAYTYNHKMSLAFTELLIDTFGDWALECADCQVTMDHTLTKNNFKATCPSCNTEHDSRSFASTFLRNGNKVGVFCAMDGEAMMGTDGGEFNCPQCGYTLPDEQVKKRATDCVKADSEGHILRPLIWTNNDDRMKPTVIILKQGFVTDDSIKEMKAEQGAE